MIQIRQNNDIVYKGFFLDKNGLKIVEKPSYSEWQLIGKFIDRSYEAVQFWRGDWLNYGEMNFEEVKRFFDAGDVAIDTLRKEKWVAKRIPLERRRQTLSWSHHEEVADLEPEDQEKMFDIAEKDGLSVHKFRKVVRMYKMRMELPELTDEELEKTDPVEFVPVQNIIDASLLTVELIEKTDLERVHVDARDYLLSHLKRVTGFYLSILNKYDKQK